ncbi:NifB/NifX family molybdenum-iron cluster-binding protein [Paludibacter sp.]
MKIAITSITNHVESEVDPRFGRCSYFAIYDTDTKTTEFIPNTAKEASEGAGPAAVQLIAKHKVSNVVSGDFGAKIKNIMDQLNIEMVIEKDTKKTIQNIINNL